MKSLKKVHSLNLDYLLVSHSLDLETENIVHEAQPKLEAYIKYREDRNEMIKEVLNKKG